MALGFIAWFTQLGYFDCDMPAMVASVAVIALAATAIESLPINKALDDNLSVPGAVALLGFLLRQAMIAA
jgi:phytol kinase